MTVLAYTLVPEARISAGKGGQVQQAKSIHRILPGTTVRGALGHTWWLSPDHAFDPAASERARQDAFDRLFGRALVVRDAVPAGVSLLRTASMLWLKYPGRAKRELKGYLDLAAGPLAACPACDAAFPEPRGWLPIGDEGAGRRVDRCPSCDSIFELAKDGWRVPDEFEVAATRTALTDGGIAKKEQLFTRLALTRDLRFRGTLAIREDAPVPPEALAWLQAAMGFHVGGQRSTLGRVTWSTKRWQADAVPTGPRVVLQLRSPALLVDERGFPTLDLARYLGGIEGAGTLACRPWLRTTQVVGWHAVAGVPKPTEWAIDTGSTAVLDGWSEDALRRLARGIGLRQLEGYGEVALKDPGELAAFGRPAVEPLLDAAPVVPAPSPAAPAASEVEAAPIEPAAPTPGPTPGPTPAAAAAPARPAPTMSAPKAEPTPAPAPSAASQAPPSDGLVRQLADLVAPEVRNRVLNGVLGAARNIAEKRQRDMPEHMIESIIKLKFSEPWAKALGPDSRDLVRAILSSPEVSDLVTQLDAERSK